MGHKPASCAMGTGSFPGVKRPDCGVDNPTPSSKGKAIPLQAWTDPEGSSRFRLPDFKTIDT